MSKGLPDIPTPGVLYKTALGEKAFYVGRNEPGDYVYEVGSYKRYFKKYSLPYRFSFDPNYHSEYDIVGFWDEMINFWEARNAALKGKRVRRVVDPGIEFSAADFDVQAASWPNQFINSLWELAEEPV
jgi:hypothetical protein